MSIEKIVKKIAIIDPNVLFSNIDIGDIFVYDGKLYSKGFTEDPEKNAIGPENSEVYFHYNQEIQLTNTKIKVIE
jgi:hypothetical protein